MSNKNKKQALIAEITSKFKKGMVLDASLIKVDRIDYVTGHFDSIGEDSLFSPCLTIDVEGGIAIDFFEKSNPIPLAQQIGLTSTCGWLLVDCTVDSLEIINQSMVNP